MIGLTLQDCLARAGANAVWVQTDAAAYEALSRPENRFDMLIVDVDLGEGTTGFDIARHARKKQQDVGIVVSTGGPPEWLDAFGVEGAVFLSKPWTEAALLSACKKASVGYAGC